MLTGQEHLVWPPVVVASLSQQSHCSISPFAWRVECKQAGERVVWNPGMNTVGWKRFEPLLQDGYFGAVWSSSPLLLCLVRYIHSPHVVVLEDLQAVHFYWLFSEWTMFVSLVTEPPTTEQTKILTAIRMPLVLTWMVSGADEDRSKQFGVWSFSCLHRSFSMSPSLPLLNVKMLCEGIPSC